MSISVRVVPHQGRTAIAVDGRVIPGMSYVSFVYSRGEADVRVFREMVEAGIRIFFCPWNFHATKYGPSAWREDGSLDFTMLDDRMAMLADLAPDIWFVPRIYLDTPHWWARRHPEELVLYADSEGHPPEPAGEHGNLAQASMASERWRSDIADVLRRLVQHVESGQFADRVLGYMPNSGGTEEWVYWGAQQGKLADYSAPALQAFRQWLVREHGTEAALAQAWRDPDLTLDKVRVPSEADRRRCAPALLRDGRRDRPAIDYDLFLSDLCAETLLHCCRAIKASVGRPCLTGSFYGYVLWQTGLANAAVQNGHIGLGRLLASPDIDFITGITSYDNREPGGPGTFMLPVESVQAAGKLVFDEVDLRTHLTAGSPLDRLLFTGAGPDVGNIWPLRNAGESLSVYRREFAHHLIHGAAWWYFDMGGGWYSCPELREEFAAQSRIARAALEWDMSSVAEVAAVVSARSPAWGRLFRMHDVNTVEWTDLQCDRATAKLYQAGVPIDWWTTSDLARPEMERYKVILFYNAHHLTTDERAAVEKLKGQGRTLIFIGYPGLATEDGLSAESASALVEMKLKLNPRRQTARIAISDYDDRFTRPCEVGATLGTGAIVSPALEVVDAASRTLGVWSLTGRPALAARDHKDWLSVFCPVPLNHAGIFRAIARAAGCHIWTEKDAVLFANRSLLAVHTTTYPEPIHLPEPMTVTDLFTGQVLVRRGRRFTPPGAWGGATGLYRMEAEA